MSATTRRSLGGIFIGVIDRIDPRIEAADEVRDRVLQAAEYTRVGRLGWTDDRGFSSFGDDTRPCARPGSRRSGRGWKERDGV